MATTGQLAKQTSDAVSRIQISAHQLAQMAGVTSPPSFPTQNRYGVEVLQRDQLVSIADLLEMLVERFTATENAAAEHDPLMSKSRNDLIKLWEADGKSLTDIHPGYVTLEDLRAALRSA